MFTHSDLLLGLARQRQHDLAAKATHHRLLSLAREARSTRRAAKTRGRPAGTLNSCETPAPIPTY